MVHGRRTNMKRLLLFLLLSAVALRAQGRILAPIMNPFPSPVASGGTAPTLVNNGGLADGTGISRSTSTTFTYQTGDIIVVALVSEGASSETFSAPTAMTNLTFSNNPIQHQAFSSCALSIFWGQATGSGSGTVTLNTSADNFHWAAWVWQYRGSSGIGNSASQFTTTKTVPLTPAYGAHSAIIWVFGDWAAAASPAVTPTSPNEHTRQATQISGSYSFAQADITDQTSAGQVSYGANYTSTGLFSIGVLEIKGQ